MGFNSSYYTWMNFLSSHIKRKYKHTYPWLKYMYGSLCYRGINKNPKCYLDNYR